MLIININNFVVSLMKAFKPVLIIYYSLLLGCHGVQYSPPRFINTSDEMRATRYPESEYWTPTSIDVDKAVVALRKAIAGFEPKRQLGRVPDNFEDYALSFTGRYVNGQKTIWIDGYNNWREKGRLPAGAVFLGGGDGRFHAEYWLDTGIIKRLGVPWE